MQELHSLIHSLTSSEWQALQVFLTAFTPRNSSNLKYLKLAKMLMEADKATTPEDCCLKIYGKKKDTGFGMLKSRLKEKVCDFLVTDITTGKKQELDEKEYAIIKIKKKSALFQQLLYSKKKMPLLYNLLDEIINTAKEYEYYGYVIEHLRLKKTLVSWKNGGKEFNKVNKEIEYYLSCYALVTKAEHHFYDLFIRSEYSGKRSNKRLSSFLEEKTLELAGYYKKTKSSIIKYFHKFLELALYQERKNYLKAHKVCLELLDVVQNSKSIYRRERMGEVYDNLSLCEYYLNHFEKAMIYSREAQKNFKLNSDNYCISTEQEFYTIFALKEYDTALELANTMLTSAPKKELGEFRHAKYNFLLANALFKLGRFKEVISILSKGLEISKDKAGWEIGIRMLTIMAHIEMKRFSETAVLIERLRKFIAFTDKKTPVSLRDKTILGFLQFIQKEEFTFSSLNSKTNKYMLFLCSNEKASRWEPFTHEIFPFHEWVEEKMKALN